MKVATTPINVLLLSILWKAANSAATPVDAPLRLARYANTFETPWVDMELGEFVLERTKLILPDGPPQIFWHCLSGTYDAEARLAIFDEGVPFEDVAIDTSTWDDPPNDWNNTINKNVSQSVRLARISIWGGSGCDCKLHQLNSSAWLAANERANSSIAIDFFQGPNIVPSSWYDKNSNEFHFDDEVEVGDDSWVIHAPYKGAPIHSLTWGWVAPTTVPDSLEFVTKSKWIRLPSDATILRAQSVGLYNIEFYLIPENVSTEDEWQINNFQSTVYTEFHLNTMDLFIASVGSIEAATAFTFPKAPSGYYYYVFIMNDGDYPVDAEWDHDPPFRCKWAEYSLETQQDVFVNLHSCDHTACNGETTRITGYSTDSGGAGGDSTDSNAGSKSAGRSISGLAVLLVATLIVTISVFRF